MNKHNRIRASYQSLQRQGGMVLVWSMVILLVLLVLAIASIQMTGLDTKIAGNEMHRMLVYQSAESGLERTSNLYYLDLASNQANRLFEVNDLQDNVNLGGGVIQSEADVDVLLPTDKEQMDCPVFSGLAMSFEATAESNQVACQMYRIDADARLANSGARGSHQLGLLKIVPSIDGKR